MPYADNAGTRIHYEVIGDGPPLVLQHGFTQSIEDWAESGYVDALRPHYRLILIDARGHGRSDKPRDEAAYALHHRVADVTAVLDAEGIARAHFWGYSMGGFIGFGMARHAPERLDALVIGGSHPYARNAETNRAWLREVIAAGGASVLAATIEKIAGHVTPAYAERLRAADLEVFLACVPSSDTIEDMLAGMTMPVCLYCGDADPAFPLAQSGSQRIPNARFVVLPGLAHLPAFSLSGIVLPPIMAFLADSR